jgi:hypothetical protein
MGKNDDYTGDSLERIYFLFSPSKPPNLPQSSNHPTSDPVASSAPIIRSREIQKYSLWQSDLRPNF